MTNDDAARTLSNWSKNNSNSHSELSNYLSVIDQIASLFAIGPYYYYIKNLQNTEIPFVHKSIEKVLGIYPDTFSVQTLFKRMHPDDRNKIKGIEKLASNFLLTNIPQNHIPDYKVMYLMRLKHKDGSYRTILHQTKALHVSDCGDIETTINVHTDVTYLKMPVNHKVSFVSHIHPTYYGESVNNSIHKIKDNLNICISNREKDIIRHISLGETSTEIANALNISVHTVNTHKKNILKKTHCANITELIAKCLMDGII